MQRNAVAMGMNIELNMNIKIITIHDQGQRSCYTLDEMIYTVAIW